MLDVQPRLFFLHSWAKNDALRLALGLNSALENAAQLDLKARSRLMAPAISGSSAAKPEWPSVRQSPPPYRSRGGSCRYAPRLAHLTRVRRREGPLPAGLAIMARLVGRGPSYRS